MAGRKFANKFNLEIIEVIKGGDVLKEAYIGEGTLINSDDFNGLSSNVAKERIIEFLEEKGLAKKQINYKLRDCILFSFFVVVLMCKCVVYNPLGSFMLPFILSIEKL